MSHPRAVAGLMAALCAAIPLVCAGSAYAADDAPRKAPGESGDAAGNAADKTAAKAAPKTAAESTGNNSEAAGAAGSDEPVDLSKPGEPAPPEPAADEVSYPERRCGFTLGVLPLGMMGASTGYPNDALRIGRDEFFTNTGFVGGGMATGWVGIAVADWLVFGLGGNYGRLLNGDYDVEMFGGGFHVDLFPLFELGGVWQEVGTSLEAGLSFTTTTFVETEQTVIDGGTSSRVALGVFYEGIRAWQLSMGPYVGFDTTFSQSAVVPVAAIGWRTALYAGPPKEAEPEPPKQAARRW